MLVPFLHQAERSPRAGARVVGASGQGWGSGEGRVRVSLCPVSCPSKLSNSNGVGGVMGTSTYRQLVRSTGDNLALETGI